MWSGRPEQTGTGLPVIEEERSIEISSNDCNSGTTVSVGKVQIASTGMILEDGRRREGN
jgi:hypothetical protein